METIEEKKDITGTLMERLFSVGAHFGFTRSRRHPTVTPYIYGNKHGTDIFDLEKTENLIIRAREMLEEAGRQGKQVLLVGTKEEVAPLIRTAAEGRKLSYVANRWIGGTLTNFPEIRKRLQRLSDLTTQGSSGELERKYTKKERVVIGRELERLHYNFDGIVSLERLPQLLIVVDPRHNSIAVREANEMHIPVIGITSSDANLKDITYPIVMNDSLQTSVSFILEELLTAFESGRNAAEISIRK